MTRLKTNLNHNLLYAASALPPAIFLLTGHVVLGLLFLACVVRGRFSRPGDPTRSRSTTKPTGS